MLAELLQKTILGNSVSAYLMTLGILLAGILLVTLLRNVVLGRLKHWARNTRSLLDDRLIHLLEKPTTYLLYLGSFYLSLGNLELSSFLQALVQVLSIVVATLLIVQLATSFLEYGIRVYWMTRGSRETLEQSLNALIPAMKVTVWAIGLVFLLDNLGFDISAVVASLGIGGIAVALASQGILADLFSYFSILLDRPFEIGDFVIIGDLVGTVEHIGIKTTRLRSLGGEEWVASNTDLTGSRIQNFRRMERRRIAFSLGVTYETGQEKIEAIPSLIQAVIESVERVTFDRAHFLSFGDFSLNYEVVYFVETPDYATYMDAQQAINLGIRQAFEAHQIDFAYPTQMLYLSGLNLERSPSPGNGHTGRDRFALAQLGEAR
ncbi:mechanosensitive ion channel family protein [Lyngbya confervoides]|uniref:Mechanosensitive ion channel family protein n=1 Tax=Lyngbya confervoides BDU141951 TaxID=1574623 RepID=A0ABD4T5E7_9CYAN|nr:mechanosensitive ion channel family protein [Lyngbya confervoides]MCM1983590.1 mechanosensitive ion channel family protein [Lyngbya confervoides BDU141951]